MADVILTTHPSSADCSNKGGWHQKTNMPHGIKSDLSLFLHIYYFLKQEGHSLFFHIYYFLNQGGQTTLLIFQSTQSLLSVMMKSSVPTINSSNYIFNAICTKTIMSQQ